MINTSLLLLGISILGIGIMIGILLTLVAATLAVGVIDWREARRVRRRHPVKSPPAWHGVPPPAQSQPSPLTPPTQSGGDRLPSPDVKGNRWAREARERNRAQVWTPIPRPDFLATKEHPALPVTDPRIGQVQRIPRKGEEQR